MMRVESKFYFKEGTYGHNWKGTINYPDTVGAFVDTMDSSEYIQCNFVNDSIPTLTKIEMLPSNKFLYKNVLYTAHQLSYEQERLKEEYKQNKGKVLPASDTLHELKKNFTDAMEALRLDIIGKENLEFMDYKISVYPNNVYLYVKIPGGGVYNMVLDYINKTLPGAIRNINKGEE